MDSLSLRQDVFKDVSDSIFPVAIREKVELLLELWRLVNLQHDSSISFGGWYEVVALTRVVVF